MGTSIEAIKLVMNSILSTKPWIRDPAVISMPWNDASEQSTFERANSDGSANDQLPFKFAIFWNDGVVAPHPPIIRGLRILHNLLKSRGHKVNTDYPAQVPDYFLIILPRSLNGTLLRIQKHIEST